MSVWDNFYRLTKLSVGFPDYSGAQSATVFGNGKNQVPVLVRVKVTDESGSAVDIPASELSEAVALINYASGEELAAPWDVSLTPGEYATPYSYGSNLEAQLLAGDGELTLTLYVCAQDVTAVRDTDIAVSLTVPGVGEFNTTAEGTDTKNGPGGTTGSVFISPSRVHVSARVPLDYSDISLLSMTQTTWDKIGCQTYVVHDYIWDSSYWTKTDGATLYRSTVKVIPSDPAFKFMHAGSSYNAVGAEDAVTGNAVWHHEDEVGIAATTMEGFFIINIIDKRFVAIGGFGKSVGNPNYDAYFWYRPDIGDATTTGHFHMIDSEWQYRAEIDIAEAGNTDNEAMLVGYKINVPTGNNVGAHCWTDAYAPVSFNVTDNFGNTGTFSIGFFGDQSSATAVGNVRLE